MHSFKVYIQLKGDNDNDSVERVKQLFVEGLKENNNHTMLIRYMDSHLASVLDQYRQVWVDKMGKSFFLIVSTKERRNIAMSAVYRERSTLLELCAGTIADLLEEMDKKDCVNDLEMPATLVQCIEKCFES